MFPDRDIMLFSNPIYSRSSSSISYSPLKIQHGISDIQIWSQCYFRFLPLLEIVGGGEEQVTHLFIFNGINLNSYTLLIVFLSIVELNPEKPEQKFLKCNI